MMMKILDRKVWKGNTADKYFSLWIRERDLLCVKCGRTENLTCSHFYDRAVYVVRFHPDNCDALCGGCHAIWEDMKQADYRDFKVRQLGKERFDALADIVRNYKMYPLNQPNAIQVRRELMIFLHHEKEN